MLESLLSRLGWLAMLLLLQVCVFNHVHIFGYATPMPYIYFLLILPSHTSRWVYVTAGFAMGLLIDCFTNTPGMAAGATCLTGLLVPPLLKLSAPSDAEEEFVPSHRNMEWGAFVRYGCMATLIHCTAFFALETFSLFDWQTLLINITGSTLLTTLFIIAMELIRNGK